MTYHPIIGLEVHIQLNTQTKLFCSCLNEYTPNQPNKNICEFCTGQPGTLPLLNQEAVKKAIRFGVAVGGRIPEKTLWDRKNYFYPDLPAGYQISQNDNPIVQAGVVNYYVENKQTGEYTPARVELNRAHLEMDAAKLIHAGGKSLVDFNRSGAPLLEVVSEPVITSAEEAMAYVKELQLLARKLDISEANMEMGQMRFDCNISLQNPDQKQAQQLPNYKVEIKNINSISTIGKAIEYEIKRQTEILEEGGRPAQETRGWRDDLGISQSQRTKEEALDYRYFPERDLPVLIINPSDIPLLEEIPKLPFAYREEYQQQGLSLAIANVFLNQEDVGELYQKCFELIEVENSEICKTIAHIITGKLINLADTQEKAINTLISEKNILALAEYFTENKISNKGLQQAIDLLVKADYEKATTQEIIQTNNLLQISDLVTIGAFADEVIEENEKAVKDYQSGKTGVIGFLVGQVLKKSKGKANPKIAEEVLGKKLV